MLLNKYIFVDIQPEDDRMLDKTCTGFNTIQILKQKLQLC